MRMWMVPPRILCRQHLLGEHVECHMFIGHLKSGRRITGYIEKNLVEVTAIVKRHNTLMIEMLRRGMRHHSPLTEHELFMAISINSQLTPKQIATKVKKDSALQELLRRCPRCKKHFYEYSSTRSGRI